MATRKTTGKVLFYDGIQMSLTPNNEVESNAIGSASDGNGIYFSEYNRGTTDKPDYTFHIGHHGHVFTLGSTINTAKISTGIDPFTKVESANGRILAQNNSNKINYVQQLEANGLTKTITPTVTNIDFTTLLNYLAELHARISALEHPAIVYHTITVNVTGYTGTYNHDIPAKIAEGDTKQIVLQNLTGYNVTATSSSKGVAISGKTIILSNIDNDLVINIAISPITYNVTLQLKHKQNGAAVNSNSDIFVIGNSSSTAVSNTVSVAHGSTATWYVAIKDQVHWLTTASSLVCSACSATIETDGRIKITSNSITSVTSCSVTLMPRTDLTITINAISGAPFSNGKTQQTFANQTWYSTLTLATPYEPAGYTFGGWSKTSTGKTNADSSNTASKIFINSETFYAYGGQQSNYYYYAGWELPTNEDDLKRLAVSPNGACIGTSLGTYSATNVLYDYTDNNVAGTSKAQFYVVIPQGVKIYDADKALCMDPFTLEGTIGNHNIYKSVLPFRNIDTIILF